MTEMSAGEYYNRSYPHVDALSRRRLHGGEHHKPEKPETLVQRLGRRIHNQRVQIARIEQFHYGMNHLKTIKRLAYVSQKYRKILAENRELEARIAALGEGK